MVKKRRLRKWMMIRTLMLSEVCWEACWFLFVWKRMYQWQVYVNAFCSSGGSERPLQPEWNCKFNQNHGFATFSLEWRLKKSKEAVLNLHSREKHEFTTFSFEWRFKKSKEAVLNLHSSENLIKTGRRAVGSGCGLGLWARAVGFRVPALNGYLNFAAFFEISSTRFTHFWAAPNP